MVPKTLSVILPNYNHSKYLPQCIDAILTQSYPPAEIIVVDDASTDNSVEILQRYAEKCPNMKLICNEVNEGSISIFQSQWRQVTGEYLYAASADDYILPGFFEKSINMMEQYPEAGFCSGLTIVEDGEKKYLFPQAYNGIAAKCTYLNQEQVLNAFIERDWPIAGNTVIWRTKAARDVNGFPKELLNLQDEFTTQMLGLNYGACFIPEPLCYYRIVPGSFSAIYREDITKMRNLTDNSIKAMEVTYSERFPSSFVKYFKRRTRYSYMVGELARKDRLERGQIDKWKNNNRRLGPLKGLFFYGLRKAVRVKKLALSLYLFLRFGSPSWFRVVRYFHQYRIN